MKRKNKKDHQMTKMTKDKAITDVYHQIQDVLTHARSQVYHAVNIAMVQAYWNIGRIIVEEEQDTVYKQEQAPHYHARQVALMRASHEQAGIILGSSAASLESYHLAHAHGKHRPILEYRNLDENSPMP